MENEKLKKSLTLFDVYAISTGAMFSAEFFLLPGLAAAYAGPSVVLAYFLSGLLVLPAMFSQAELATAMPRAGGTYYFIDRALGPMMGTIGGLGTWLSLVFKSAFALIGMGAYLVLFMDMPIKPVAVGLTVAFTLLNVFGAKETSGLQRFLVTMLVAILALFVIQGLIEIFSGDVAQVAEDNFTPFMPFGIGGVLSTIGLVFAAYAGLTKVASVAEEVKDPDRNIPLGMFLSLATAIFVYTVGVYVMVAVLDIEAMKEDLTPVASAAEQILDWIPTPGAFPELTGVLLIAVAALAAFASTGNAGILSASRYPLAMARDRLIMRRFDSLSRFGTPAPAILITGGAMVVSILVLDVEGVAKLASAFNLLVFGMINLAVIVMRESRIPSYAPGFRTPLYPWMQIVGIVSALFLIIEIGLLSIAFTMGIIAACIGWYFYYVRSNDEVEREGAIYHLFERLGRRRYDPLDRELRIILKEKGVIDEARFERLIARAPVVDIKEETTYEDIVAQASHRLANRLDLSEEVLRVDFMEGSWRGATPVAHGVALPHQRRMNIEQPELVMVRACRGVTVPADVPEEDGSPADTVYAIFFLVSDQNDPGQHLRILANIASRIDEPQFLSEWRAAEDEQQLKETLLHYERYLSLYVHRDLKTADMIGKAVRDLNLPPGNLIALITRGRRSSIPDGNTVLEEGDRLTIIGETAGIQRLMQVYADEDEE